MFIVDEIELLGDVVVIEFALVTELVSELVEATLSFDEDELDEVTPVVIVVEIVLLLDVVVVETEFALVREVVVSESLLLVVVKLTLGPPRKF